VLAFKILGPLEAVDGDRPVALGGRKQRALLAVLLLHRNEVLSTDRLVDALWGEHAPSTATATVRVYVSNLRKALGADAVVTQGSGYVLQLTRDQLDADQFEALAADARGALAGGDAVRARELLERALGLWRGEALADLAYEPFAQAPLQRMTEARLGAIEDRVEADLMLGRHRELVGELDMLVGEYPTRERLLGFHMLALYRSGRHVEALEAYRRGRDRLGDALGLEPGPELRALEVKILNHDSGLEATPPPTPRPLGVRPIRRGRVLIAAGGAMLLVAATSAGIAEFSGGTTVLAAPNTVAAIDTGSGLVTGVAAVGTRPGPIAFGSGSLWIANVDDQSVSRVDPTSLRTLATISLGQTPTGIASTNRTVWVTTENPSGPSVAVERIDPTFDTLDRAASVGNVDPATPAPIAAQGAALWVAPYAGNVTELDTGTGRILRQVDPNAGPSALAVGAGGVWVTDGEADTVTRIDPSGLTTPIAVGYGPGAIAIGAGAVWVADRGDNSVVRIDPVTAAVTAKIPVGDAPGGVAVGDGSVWVANSGEGTVSRIDPASMKVAATIDVGGSPQDITVVGQRAWVTVDQPTVPAARTVAGGTLRIDSAGDVDYVDPALAYGALSVELLYATCAKLLNYPDQPGPAGTQLIPEVARSLPSRSADGRTYTFTIRPGFRFSPPSNAPVTAETFKYTIERTLNPRMHNPVTQEFSDIVGAPAYMAGHADHITGVTAAGDTLTIRLTHPLPDILARLSQPFFCAVPTDTPIDPAGLHSFPSAGPYYVTSYTPGEGALLTANPNYHGKRPHSLASIELRVDVPPGRAVNQVEAGTADYATSDELTPPDVAALASRYGPASPAARAGHQQYFVHPFAELDFLTLNTHRSLFADTRLRRAVSYAIDRSALARLGGLSGVLPDEPTDDYLPPGVPGAGNVQTYPLTADITAARSLAGHRAATVVLYTCDTPPCPQQAQIIKTDLAAIGLTVKVDEFTLQTLYTRIARPGEAFDMASIGWGADYPDPADMLNVALESGAIFPAFDDPSYQQKLAAAEQLTGPIRYLTYARLDADLVRYAAPWVAFGNASTHELFSSRIGCQTYGTYGLDLAALCVRNNTG
jgi:YVTN family beta-propeller protein